MTSPLRPGHLTWGLGIEDTCVHPPARYGMSALDEHALTGHDRRWRDDLRAARDLGATMLRYGASWPLANPAPGTFDWAALDERLELATELGLTVVADLVHYGTPPWLDGSFADPGYPDAVAAFGGAFAARYRDLVDHVTPLNEPLTTASFSGLRGVWPPALVGWRGWVEVTLNLVEGIVRTVDAVTAVNPTAVVVHVEAASHYTPGSPELRATSDLLARVGFLPTDLVTGRVTPEHELHGWLVDHGADPARLARIAAAPARVDLVGVNYYPDLTPRLVTAHGVGDGEAAQVTHNLWTAGLEGAVRAFADRYARPVLVTETSIEGDDELRADWLRSSAAAVHGLLAAGVDVRGYTWWPFFDFVDWSYASGGVNVEEFAIPDDVLAARLAAHAAPGHVATTPFLRRMGLVALDEHPDGTLVLRPTPAAAEFAVLSGAAPDPRGEEVQDAAERA